LFTFILFNGPQNKPHLPIDVIP